MKFIVGMVKFNWRVWSVPDFDFQNLEGMIPQDQGAVGAYIRVCVS